jgi:hypothetical protein
MLSWALPLGLLLVGLPLALLATGLRLKPIVQGVQTIPVGALWLWGLVRKPDFGSHHQDDEDDADHEYDDDDEGAYHLDADDSPGSITPEPIAATRLAERQKTRVKRDMRAPIGAAKRDKQPALNLASGDYQLPAFGRTCHRQGHAYPFRRGAGRKCPHAGSGAGRFRRQGPHHRRASGPGGHAV